MIYDSKEAQRHCSYEKENCMYTPRPTYNIVNANCVLPSQRRLKDSLKKIHAKLAQTGKRPHQSSRFMIESNANKAYKSQLSDIMPWQITNNTSAVSNVRRSLLRSHLSKEESKLSDLSEIKIANLSIKREVVKAAKKLLPAEFVTIQTLFEISNDLQKAQAISRHIAEFDKQEFDEFFKNKQIKTKKSIFSKRKFVLLCEVDGFLAKTSGDEMQLNHGILSILRQHQARFCFVAYTRHDNRYLAQFKHALGKEQSVIEYFIGASHCYIYEDKQIKLNSVVKEPALLIDSDLTSLYANRDGTVYLPKSHTNAEFEKFNIFFGKLCTQLTLKSFKTKDALAELGLNYNILTPN